MAEGAIDSRRFCIFDTFMPNAVSGANGKNKCTPLRNSAFVITHYINFNLSVLFSTILNPFAIYYKIQVPIDSAIEEYIHMYMSKLPKHYFPSILMTSMFVSYFKEITFVYYYKHSFFKHL